MAVVAVVTAWAIVQAAFVIAAVARPGPQNRPSIFAGLFDIRM
jgi:hypothetical protein